MNRTVSYYLTSTYSIFSEHNCNKNDIYTHNLLKCFECYQFKYMQYMQQTSVNDLDEYIRNSYILLLIVFFLHLQ